MDYIDQNYCVSQTLNKSKLKTRPYGTSILNEPSHECVHPLTGPEILIAETESMSGVIKKKHCLSIRACDLFLDKYDNSLTYK